jgi:hypothetical protein
MHWCEVLATLCGLKGIWKRWEELTVRSHLLPSSGLNFTPPLT